MKMGFLSDCFGIILRPCSGKEGNKKQPTIVERVKKICDGKGGERQGLQ